MRYRLPVRPRVCDYLQLPIRTSTAYVRRLNSTVGWRFVILMTSVYFGIKGTLGTFVGVGQLPYFKEHLKVSGSEYQAYRTAAMTPWAMKALMGAISDSIPIAGYFKRYYIVMASVVGTVAFLLLSTVQLSEGQEWIAALMFMMVHFEMALVDLLCEGAYAAIMSKFAFSGSDIVTWVWTMVHSGGLLAALVVGPLAKAGYIRGMFIICVPIAAQVAIPTLLGYLPEKRLPKNSRGPQIGKMLKHKKILLLAIGMAVAAMGLGICNMIAYEPLTLVYALTSSTLMVVASFSVMPRNLALSNLFLFLLAASYINLGGALDYFYLADKECNPGGPQFDDVYYYTWSSIAQSVFGAVGVLFFQTFLSHWPFRRVFWVTVLLRGVAATVDIIIVNRWNLIIGISDKMMYMVGYNSLYQVIGMLEFMAAVVLTTKMCPKNIESTVYALLAGFQNFGSTVSSSIGVAMMNYFDIRTQIPCDFTHLTTLIVISHMVLPLMCIPLTFVLLPDAYMTDTLNEHGELVRNHSNAGDSIELKSETNDDLDTDVYQ
ncbi:hypothetical protein SARC_05559 [Sphaeroforma arctica JP610]|uniref:Uncharacterized protein n=1 Tax=Sphaeroforma arctica JP610 TaxID=667725 RepID=A0A0L0FZW5_9EUKA|nr:hypothetical protein SARC_05559 [Sphaeroforma arctica JP610]KNC82139.1 hypothetical protein SARC_05559 [Sphaeroforma arctica JP610]|eukprot:XP_014156041.1 hypothetical protein SARC_05559 [Sphaeroforma arctica JP610]